MGIRLASRPRVGSGGARVSSARPSVPVIPGLRLNYLPTRERALCDRAAGAGPGRPSVIRPTSRTRVWSVDARVSCPRPYVPVIPGLRLNYLPTVGRGRGNASLPRVRARRGNRMGKGVPSGVSPDRLQPNDGPETGGAARQGRARTAVRGRTPRKRQSRPVRSACPVRQVRRTACSRSVAPAASRTSGERRRPRPGSASTTAS